MTPMNHNFIPDGLSNPLALAFSRGKIDEIISILPFEIKRLQSLFIIYLTILLRILQSFKTAVIYINK